MRNSNLIAMLLVVTILASACTKDKDDTEKVNRVELLTTGTWQLTGHMYVDPSGTETDRYAAKRACQNDNIYQFNKDKTYTVSDGATKCYASDPEILSRADWQLRDDTLILNSTGTTFSRHWIKTFNSNTFVIINEPTGNGHQHTYTYTKN